MFRRITPRLVCRRGSLINTPRIWQREIMGIAEGIFWGSTASVAYAYAIYPPVIYACSRLFGRAPSAPEVNDVDLPSISLLIAAHNEDAVIEERIHNALAMDYPREKLQIVIASDGS